MTIRDGQGNTDWRRIAETATQQASAPLTIVEDATGKVLHEGLMYGSPEALAAVRTPTSKRFRKKPVVIHAIQYSGTNREAVEHFALDCENEAPVELVDGSGMLISTLEGDMLAAPGDWIICGVKNELYPCKPDIFAATYEAVE